jgi:hypothetical protein
VEPQERDPSAGGSRAAGRQLRVTISSTSTRTASRRWKGRKRPREASCRSDASAKPTAYGASRGSLTARPLPTACAARRRRPLSRSSRLTSVKRTASIETPINNACPLLEARPAG